MLLHVGATLLLLGMLCALTGEPAPSAFVAGAFALHPLRAESVAWVSERKDVLAAVLWMSTMWLVHSNLGFLLAAQGNLDEAVDHYAAALREDPNLAPAHNNLGLALESLGRRDEALRHYSRAVELAPADLQNRLNYARALARSGRRGDAIGELREVLRRQPDWPPAEQDLIRLLAADADPARRTEAIALAETWCSGRRPGTRSCSPRSRWRTRAPRASPTRSGFGATRSALREPVAAPIFSRASKPRWRRAAPGAHPERMALTTSWDRL